MLYVWSIILILLAIIFIAIGIKEELMDYTVLGIILIVIAVLFSLFKIIL
jgi:hypothetical protein